MLLVHQYLRILLSLPIGFWLEATKVTIYSDLFSMMTYALVAAHRILDIIS